MMRNFMMAMSFMTVSSLSMAAPQKMVDFVPTSLKFQKSLVDDVSGSYAQLVSLRIKNNGNTPSRYPGSIMRVLLNGAVFNANVYGSNGSGGFNLNAPIAPGQEGVAMFYLQLNTLRHCSRVNIQIDADRTYQYGGNVFTNDTKLLTAIDPTSIRFCGPVVVKPLPSEALQLDAENDPM